MHYVLLLILGLTYTNFTRAQVDLDKDLIEAAKVLAVGTEELDKLKTFNEAGTGNPNDCDSADKDKKLISQEKPAIVVDSIKTPKWSFSVRSTLTGPKEQMEKAYYQPQDNESELSKKLNNIIKGNFDNHEDRLKAVTDSCQGLSELEMVRMSSMLAGKLAGIYDYSRANGGNKNIVTPEEQWSALKSRGTSGVCRDTAYTVAQFAIACGIPKDKILLKAYTTETSGHMIPVIALDMGEYSLNWDELYSNEGLEAPEPNIPNVGLYYRVYDPVTGKLLEQKKTDFARALNIATGGKDHDPYYTPQMLLMEAAHGNLAVNVFEIETDRGDKAKGGSLVYSSRTGGERSFVDLSYGVAYARNERDISLNATSVETLKQDVIYLQMNNKVQAAFDLYKSDVGRLQIAPHARMAANLAIEKNSFRGQDNNTKEYDAEVAAGATIYFDHDPIKARITAEASASPTGNLYYSENGKNQQGFYLNRYVVGGALSWENDRLVVTGQGNVIVSKLEKEYTAGVGVTDKKYNASCEAAYSIYERNYGRREDYVVTRCQKDFKIEKIGSAAVDFQLKKSVNSDQDDVVAYLGTKIKF